ncbi:amino acid adenylation domain-containing protein [Streptomyces kaniharaensis]|uniref:Amino acid adenylation domain-containing protein n=1 Tax=Streptomyces kaniharaensis TaxID=212423 RepID=A0A6N7KY89_9ACTN|nr:non-ribosomal peptide synthetase [Streptomyces kaniharaensis]MQS14934.1 amino acid adenylation domain-containing protein [Streptomyces kaniharaensis]
MTITPTHHRPGPAPVPRDPAAPQPLSFAQQRMWFAEQLAPGTALQNVPLAVRLTGRLDTAALTEALRRVVARHESLRTSFAVVDATPVQRIAPEAVLTVDHRDLSGLPEAAREKALRGWLDALATTPFELDRAPLVRVGLARLGEDVHVLAATLHHLVADGWSTGVLMRELSAYYAALVGEGPAELPELPLQYADFAIRQRERVESGALDGALDYWREHLADEDAAPLELPTDRPRPEEPGYRGARARRPIPGELVARVGALARSTGATPFMVLLAGYASLLGRITGRGSVVVGTPIAGRNQLETEQLIGLFVNTLALRVDLAGDPEFTELVRRVRKAAIGGFAHQELPFEKIVEARRPDRASHLSPLFQTMFVLQSATGDEFRLPGLDVATVETDTCTARFELQLFVSLRPEGWVATLEYDTDLYDVATADAVLERYLTLLAGAVAEPATRLSRLPVLSPADEQIALELGRSTAEFPVEHCLHQLFEEQARLRPDAVAVRCAGEQISYAELDARADRLAARLRGAGLGPEQLVGLFLERGIDTVVAILGVLKTGAGYVPMDPLYPRPRLARILADARPPVVLVHESLRELLPPYEGRLLDLDDQDAWGPDGPAAPAQAEPRPDNAAYVIYTSGSTGTPKGVHTTHSQVVRMYAAMRAATDAMAFDEHDTWALFHSFAFDVSVVEMWGALLHGGRLVIVPADTIRDIESYRELVCAEGVTVLNQTPSAFAQLSLVDAAHDPAEFPVRTVLFGGEALEPGALRSWFERHGERGPRLVNLYGITETIHVTAREITPADLALAGRSPIGRPMPDQQLYVLDDLLQPVPVGVTGELYVGGAGLARCYFADPHKTADRYVPNPFGRPGERLYKSGDLARISRRGELEYLGRADHQVKIRGYRIETAEIEARLLDHPLVHSAVVVPLESATGELQLYAWATLDAESAAECTADETGAVLRSHLAEQLPGYMVPAAVLVLDALPLTVNGKVDRRALPRPDADQAVAGIEYVAPRTDTERRVAAAWCELLGRERIGVLDNFFDLGGHSLLATQLVFRLREEFGTELPLRTLFAVPTVAGVAEALDGADGRTDGPDLEGDAAVLGDGIAGYPAPAAPGGTDEVLLTGATGFLGAFLLGDLLARTGAVVNCLVRAADEASGRERIERTLRGYGLWRDGWAGRVRPVPGDLGAPRLGLSEADHRRLVADVEAIYHCGAEVNLVFPYEKLRAANVDGTREVLRLATATGRAPVHLVSTVGVFAGAPEDGSVLAESAPTGPSRLLRQGYTQSKWVAEQLVFQARKAGVPVTVHRPGRISGHSGSGACQADDFLWRVVKGCVEAGAVPRDVDVPMNLVPVDYVSATIVEVSRRPEALGGAYHEVNPADVSLGEIFGHLRDFGYRLELLDTDAWLARIRATPENSAFPLLSVFESGSEGGFGYVAFGSDRTRELLDGSGVTCHAPDAELFRTYLSYFASTGYLPNPATAQKDFE